jgi:hypothetical protein
MVSRLVARYIRRQRDRLDETGSPLAVSAKAEMADYFSAADLERVRIAEGDPLPIPEPPFSGVIRALGLDYPDISLTAAITFDHVIATREAMSSSLLFHELVHVVQYRLLGVRSFAQLYVRGFLAHRRYEKIPLECCAFELEARYCRGTVPFSVEAEVKAWIERGRL